MTRRQRKTYGLYHNVKEIALKTILDKWISTLHCIGLYILYCSCRLTFTTNPGVAALLQMADSATTLNCTTLNCPTSNYTTFNCTTPFNCTAPAVTPAWYDRLSWTGLLAVHAPLALVADRSVTPVWYAVGAVGNVLAARVWSERRVRRVNSSAIYLATLSLTDLLFLALHALQELQFAWGVPALAWRGGCEAYFVLVLAAQYLSPLLVLGFTVERWIAVCHPFEKRRFCTSARAVRVTAALAAWCGALCLVQAYFWTYDGAQCRFRAAAVGPFWTVWTWCTEVLMFLLVPVVILVFNILVIREVRRLATHPVPGHHADDAAHARLVTTATLLSVSFYVIVTTLPATLVYAIVSEFPEGDARMTDAEMRRDAVWQRYFEYVTTRKVVEEVCLSHYACNVFLYLATGEHFRSAVRELFTRRRKPPSKSFILSDISLRNNFFSRRSFMTEL